MIRSSYSQKNLLNFIKENQAENKIKNISLILNAVGSSKAFGYKYGYQYGIDITINIITFMVKINNYPIQNNY